MCPLYSSRYNRKLKSLKSDSCKCSVSQCISVSKRRVGEEKTETVAKWKERTTDRVSESGN